MPNLEDQNISHLTSQLDLPAINVVLVSLRTRVLSCIRKAPNGTTHLEDPSSDFMRLLQQLEGFRKSLPARLELSPLNLYILKDSYELGSVVFLHMLYHAAICDLTRIALPGFSFPLAAGMRTASPDFNYQCAQQCRFHAEEISAIIAQISSADHSAFDDPSIADATAESTKIQIIYSAAVSNHANFSQTKANILTNLELLDTMRLDRTKVSPHVRLRTLTNFGINSL